MPLVQFKFRPKAECARRVGLVAVIDLEDRIGDGSQFELVFRF